MKQIIQKIFYRMKQDSLAKKTAEKKRTKQYPDLYAMKNCLIVWCAGDRQEEYLKLFKKRLPPQVKLDKICFLSEGSPVSSWREVVYVKEDELGFGGKILNEQLQILLNKEYDLLVDLSEESNVMIDYILRNSSAKCKAGMKKENFDADLMIDNVSGIPEFIDKLFEVLAKLKRY